MKIKISDQGYYHFYVNGIEIILFLTEDLLPQDQSLDKLRSIACEFNVHKRLIGLPDLNFKDKNFVPSGMVIPLKDQFSPLLLGPNNDGMGALKIRVKSNQVSDSDIKAIFKSLKSRLAMFRRKENIIDKEILQRIFMMGIQEIIEDWGFPASALDKFEDRGCSKRFTNLGEIVESFPRERDPSLPEFVPNHDIFDRGIKCIGVLDGTSHFIELFKADESINSEHERTLNIGENDYFFLVHAGAGDICLLSHRAYLNKNNNKYILDDDMGRKAYNSFAVAGNYAFANRLYIYRVIKEVVQDVLSDLENVEIFSDLTHDYLQTDGDLFIHRKGAVKLSPARYFPVGVPWSKTGTPYLFPSCVGGDAYIVSNPEGNETAFYTASHGAGRLIRKGAAIDLYSDMNIIDSMRNKIMLFRYGVDQIEGQNPQAFKDIDKVLDIFRQHNLAHPITKLKPVASLKA